MSKDVEVTPSELYRNLADCLGMIRWGGASFTVQKRGEPLARLISAGDVPPGKDGKRRFPRPAFGHKAITPGRFRRRMSEYLSRARFGRQSLRIESRGKIVAIIVPPAGKGN